MKKELLTINRDTLIKNIYHDFERKYSKQEIKSILDDWEWWINQYMTQATPTRDVQVRTLLGLQLNSTYKSDLKKNMFGKIISIPPYIQTRARLTKSFQNGINQMAKGEA